MTPNLQAGPRNPFLLGYSQLQVVRELLLNHRTIGWFALGGTFKGHLVQPHCNKQGHLPIIRLLLTLSNLALKVSKVGSCTTYLGHLLQCFYLFIKNFFLLSSLSVLSFSLKLLSLVLSQQHPTKKSVSVFFASPLWVLKSCNTVSLKPSFPQAEPQLSQPVLIGEVFQATDCSCGPPLDLYQQVHIFLILKSPEVDVVLQVPATWMQYFRCTAIFEPWVSLLQETKITDGFKKCSDIFT